MSRIKLSISILVSGRKETRKCLDSVKKIMDKIPCELILVDTGCDEITKSILKEYTDIIIPFEWCNDFSKARNVGLERASGEWFMYIDDDEWFEDVTDIVDFFETGEYKKYHAATYLQRNYLDMTGKRYKDAVVSRMTELNENIKFQSAIHEYLIGMCMPVKVFNTYVNHYGYVFENEKSKYEHSMRNVSLLIETMKKEPMNLRWDTQLMQEYMGIGEYEKTIEICKNALDKCRSNKIDEEAKKAHKGNIYAFIGEAYIAKYNYSKAEEYIDLGLKDDIFEIGSAYLYKLKAYINYKKQNYSECSKCAREYIKIYDTYKDDSDIFINKGGLIVTEVFQEYNYQTTMLYGAMSELKMENNKEFDFYFKRLNFDSKYMIMIKEFFSNLIDYMSNEGCNERFVNYASIILQRKEYKEDIIKMIIKVESNYRNNLKEDSDKEDVRKKFDNLVAIFSKVEDEHWYVIYLKILDKYENHVYENMNALFEQLFTKIYDIFDMGDYIWEIADKSNVDLDAVFNKIDFNTWSNGICHWIDKANREDIKYREDIISRGKNKEDIRYDYFFMKVEEGLVLNLDLDKCSFQELEDELFEFASKTVDYYKKIYTDAVFSEYEDILPPECRLATKLLEIRRIRQNGSSSDVVKKMKELVDMHIKFSDIIKKYVVLYGEYAKNLDAKNDVNEEMLQLSSALKVKAREFIEQGNDEQARRILQQVIMYVPSDLEAKEIMMMIEE